MISDQAVRRQKQSSLPKLRDRNKIYDSFLIFEAAYILLVTYILSYEYITYIPEAFFPTIRNAIFRNENLSTDVSEQHKIRQ